MSPLIFVWLLGPVSTPMLTLASRVSWYPEVLLCLGCGNETDSLVAYSNFVLSSTRFAVDVQNGTSGEYSLHFLKYCGKFIQSPYACGACQD